MSTATAKLTAGQSVSVSGKSLLSIRPIGGKKLSKQRLDDKGQPAKDAEGNVIPRKAYFTVVVTSPELPSGAVCGFFPEENYNDLRAGKVGQLDFTYQEREIDDVDPNTGDDIKRVQAGLSFVNAITQDQMISMATFEAKMNFISTPDFASKSLDVKALVADAAGI